MSWFFVSVAFALCPSSAVLYDVGAGFPPGVEVPRDHVRVTACHDLPSIAAWNRSLEKECLYQVRMRNGRVHLDEAVREEGRCVARPAALRLLAKQTALKAGRHRISDLPLIMLRGRGLQITPWQPAFDHEDWPDVVLPTDNPSLEELLDLVYPEGWEIIASRHVNTRAVPIRTSLREHEQSPFWGDTIRSQISDVYEQRMYEKISHAEMVARIDKIMAVIEARTAKGTAPVESDGH